jgi:dUTP pyrophosphatase
MEVYSFTLYPEKENNFYKDVKFHHEGDSGLDLYFPKDVLVPAGETVKIDLGLKGVMKKELRSPWTCEKDDPCFDCKNCYQSVYWSYDIRPRSSIYKTPLRLANSVGTIDAGYRGNLMVVVDNIKNVDFMVKGGTSLFQVCVGDLSPFTASVSTNSSIPASSRGVSGFGSTNKI